MRKRKPATLLTGEVRKGPGLGHGPEPVAGAPLQRVEVRERAEGADGLGRRSRRPAAVRHDVWDKEK